MEAEYKDQVLKKLVAPFRAHLVSRARYEDNQKFTEQYESIDQKVTVSTTTLLNVASVLLIALCIVLGVYINLTHFYIESWNPFPEMESLILIWMSVALFAILLGLFLFIALVLNKVRYGRFMLPSLTDHQLSWQEHLSILTNVESGDANSAFALIKQAKKKVIFKKRIPTKDIAYLVLAFAPMFSREQLKEISVLFRNASDAKFANAIKEACDLILTAKFAKEPRTFETLLPLGVENVGAALLQNQTPSDWAPHEK